MPELAYLGPDAPTSVDSLRNWCEKQFDELARYEKIIEQRYVRPRDPKRALAEYLASQHPLDVVFEAIRLLERHRPTRHASAFFRALHEVAVFSLVGFASVPLRVGTWCLLRLDHVQTHRDGTLWVHAPKEIFKNRHYLQSDYNVQVPEWAQPYWERYLHEWRQHLPGAVAGSPFVLTRVFPGPGKTDASGTLIDLRPMRPKSMYVRMQQYTFATIGRALGCHWVRHLAATDFLKNNPGNYPAAAAILHDKLETVIREYGHLETGDYFRLFADYSSRRFAHLVSDEARK
jgi:hypothetical protein